MPDPDIAVYSFKVERQTLNQIRAIAQGEHRHLNQKLRQLIEQEIARHESAQRQRDLQAIVADEMAQHEEQS